ncbi:ethylene-responsive transcription factor ERF043-like [Glycine soja]|uniref:ethylene-responsive transcription factor ERF043-like n=1 Tax=Glycine soja TaxID=3848 RepID=UPI00103A81EB|nr:ethylene-responsive transcription factor ERF043-like [Glycine soja]
MGKEECYQEFQQKKLETEPESKKIKRIHGGVDEDLSNKHPLYHDVRMRNWGKWVSEIREPWKKSRIWLGTFPTPEMAVWAHNVAALSIKGSAAILNFLHFANSLPCPTYLTPQDVQAAAAKVVHMDPSSLSSLNEQVQFHLDVLDLDLAIMEEKSATITDASSNEEKVHYKVWERYNRLNLMFMRMTVADIIKTALPKTDNAKQFMGFKENTVDRRIYLKASGSKGTKNHMLTYRRSDHLEVIGYSDSDFARCVDTRKLTIGFVFLLAKGAVSWKSAKQSVVGASIMEAEFLACFEATIQAN